MNAERISQLLAATVGPERDQANQAEKELDSMQKVTFLPFPKAIEICFVDSFLFRSMASRAQSFKS